MNTLRFLVSGKVQGVWFRASACEQALALQLHGYARNLSDGDVEVVARGEDAALAALEAWLCRGPPLAKVIAVRRETLKGAADFDDFIAR